jgi:hypothetical protein
MHGVRVGLWTSVIVVVVFVGCNSTPKTPTDYVNGSRVDSANLAEGPAPRRFRSPVHASDPDTFEDSLTGGQVFQMYCSQCHNRRPMFERPFANYQNVAAHMRTRANLTGKEYDLLVEWMRRMGDAELPNPDVAPTPKRFQFSQPIPELRDSAPGPPG